MDLTEITKNLCPVWPLYVKLIITKFPRFLHTENLSNGNKTFLKQVTVIAYSITALKTNCETNINNQFVLLISARKLSPTAPSRLSPVPLSLDKDEGISDEEDPAELRLLLELNEQEASVLRRKVEELETENSTTKRQIKDLEERLILKDSKKLPTIISRTPAGINSANEKRIRELEESVKLLNKKLAQKEHELAQAASSRSDASDTQTINFKRKLEIVEQEATVLRTKMNKYEQENEKLTVENKKLSMQAIRNSSGGPKKDQDRSPATVEVNKIKEELKLMELERDELKEKVKLFMEASIKKLPMRSPKKYSDDMTKPQVKV